MPAINRSNQISIDMPDEVRADILATIASVHQKLEPYVVEMTPLEIRGLSKMGDRNVAFVSRTLGYLKANPAMCPSYLDVAEFERDLAGFSLMESFEQPLQQLLTLVRGSGMLCGAEAYAASLMGYAEFKACARRNVPGAAVIAADLGAQFAGRGARPVVPPADVPAPAAAAK